MFFCSSKLKHVHANFIFFVKKVNCAESCVGDARVRGISGGEKKRLSLACELIASPSVIFADEPTTGCPHYESCFLLTIQLICTFGIIIYVHVLASTFYMREGYSTIPLY